MEERLIKRTLQVWLIRRITRGRHVRPGRGVGERNSGPTVFFSSRRRHTRLRGDWSSDVCSSDLNGCWCITAAPWSANSISPANAPRPWSVGWRIEFNLESVKDVPEQNVNHVVELDTGAAVPTRRPVPPLAPLLLRENDGRIRIRLIHIHQQKI